jgi:alpha-L-rhamnosidase
MSDWPMSWNALWIWAPAPPHAASPVAPASIPPPETHNRFCYLRHAFDLASVPAAAPARVTADSRFVLYLNGYEVARGPARSIPARLAFSALDLAPHLRTGRNTIAALVRFYGAPVPWWIPAPANWQLGFGSFLFEAPELGVFSDGSWKALAAPYRAEVASPRALGQPPLEILDGARVPSGWTSVDFDDRAWPAAAELAAATLAANRTRPPLEPFTAPEFDDIAPLTAIPVELTEVARRAVATSLAGDPREAYPPSDHPPGGADTMITYAAAGETLATPWVRVRGPAGAIVDLYAGEYQRSDGSAKTAPREYAMRYLLSGRGEERVEAFEAVGFQYLTAVARGGAEITAAGATERRYPHGDAARFECDDLRLSKIWRVGVRTLELCSTDAFIDCPGREQRAWLGDSYLHTLLTLVGSTDWRLIRRHLRICAQSRRADGLLAMVAAGDLAISSTTIPDYSLHWVRALARYFEYSGDAALARELLPAAGEVLDSFERYRAPDGIIRAMPGWIFIDWAMTDRAEVVGALDALYAAALDDFAALAEAAAGDARAAANARARAQLTRRAFELLWDGAAGVYLDAADAHGPRRRVSQQTNVAAIVGGCAPRERWARMLDYVLDQSRVVVTPTISDDPGAYFAQRMNPADYGAFDPERSVVAAQPFFSHFVHDALVRAGRRAQIAERCIKWWPQIERGDSTFEEYWSARPGTGSRCHAWSATPTYDLTTHVLGVHPLKPGYAEAEIAPTFGSLTHLEGAVPTPHGLIEVELDRRRGGEVTIPPGVSARVRFDDAPLAGARLGAGRHRIAAP